MRKSPEITDHEVIRYFSLGSNKVQRPAARWAPIEVVVAAVIASMAYALVLGGGSLKVLVPFQAILIALPFLSTLLGIRSRFFEQDLLLWSVFSALLVFSLIRNWDSYAASATSQELAVAHALGVIALCFSAQWISANLDPLAVFRNVSFMLVPLIAFALVVSFLAGGFAFRQFPLGIHANWWGELVLCFAFGAFAVRSPYVKWTMVSLGCLLMAVVQSRGALVAVVGGGAAYFVLSTASYRMSPARFLTPLLAALLGVGVLLTNPMLLSQAGDVIIDKVLLLNDPQRGLGSGLTGRLEGWQQALSVFGENVLFGNGLDTLQTVHNGILRVAGEVGIIFLFVFLILFCRALWQSYLAGNAWRFSVLLAYLAYSLTYPRMLNMNLAAALYFTCVFSWGRSVESQHGNQRRAEIAIPG